MWSGKLKTRFGRTLAVLLVLLTSFPGATVRSAPVTTPKVVSGPALSVDVQVGRHPISLDIYGMNFYGTNPNDYTGLMQELRLPVDRWGGNVTSRYNWQTNSFNSGFDYFFEGNPNTGNDPALNQPSESDDFVSRDFAYHVKSLLGVPTIGYVEKNRTEHLCGFSVLKYGPQTATSPTGPDCGNGILTATGQQITNNDPLDTSIAVGPAFVQQWIAHLIQLHGNAASGGVQIYELDNEPSGWWETHRDVHPAKLTYEELKDYTYRYGAAIKTADPTAKTLGPSNYGFSVYADSLVPNDKANHGGVGFSEWYLQQMKAYETANGVRILDYFDQHYYPASDGVSLSPAGSPAIQQLRLRSTRSLWDPTYYDESYITTFGYGPIRLIPVFHDWVDANYPGTKIGISEYNFGGLEDINGALTQADVLGIFGRENLDLATLWAPPSSSQPGINAFRIYRNYDGTGKAYGDTGVKTNSVDQGSLAIYAAQRSRDQAVTMVIINKTGTDIASNLSLSGFTPDPAARVYRYSAANLAGIVRQADQAVTAGGFQATYPANSITLVELQKFISLGNTWTVKVTTDDGTGNGTDTLSKAISQAMPNDTIKFMVPGNQVSLTGPIGPVLKSNVNFDGGDCTTSTPTTINFRSNPGLTLAGGNSLKNLKLQGQAGPVLGAPSTGTGNRVICTTVQKT